MKRFLIFVAAMIVAAGLDLTHSQAQAAGPTAEPKGKTCHMEQQCHWENFKKICTYVKVCR